MNFVQKKEVVLIAFLIIFSLSGCFDKPNEFIAPKWDTQVNIPLTAKEFNLLEIVEKDSSLLKSYQNPETMGLIYFGDTQSISTIVMENELKLDPFVTTFSQGIGTIKVNVPIPAASEIKVEDWTTDVTSGSFQVFPEQEGMVNIEVKGVESVESILADQGTLTLIIWNKLPVDIVLRGVRIQNKADQSLIAEQQGINPADWIDVPALQSKILTFPVDGKIITNSLEYIGTIWSGGSNGSFVQVPQEAGTTILALFENLVIGAATAPLPVQSFEFNKSIVLDDSTKIEEGIISEGSFIITANNNMDVSLIAKLNFDNLYDLNGKQYSLDIPLNRNEKNKTIEVVSLNNWKVVTNTPGIPSNEISFYVEVLTDSTGEVSSISKNDSVSFNINFNELVFESFTGLFKPKYIKFKDNQFKLNYGDFDKQLNFGNINFKDANFYLNISSSAAMNLLINGNLSVSNGITSNSKSLEDIIIPTEQPTKIDITDLINGFSSELPDSFSMVGSALLNPYYQLGTAARNDSIFGTIDFEFPLNVGIAEGSFTDTFEVDLGDINRDDINQLNYGEVTFTIINSVPVGLRITASVLDSNYNSLLAIPALYNDIDYVEIPKPVVSSTGDVLSISEKTQTLTLSGDDIKILLDNPYMLINVEFSTAGENNIPVKFKTSNKISIDIKAKAEYRVEL